MEFDFTIFYYVIIHMIILIMGILLIFKHFEIKTLEVWKHHFKTELALEKEFGNRILKQFNKEHATVMELKKALDKLQGES